MKLTHSALLFLMASTLIGAPALAKDVKGTSYPCRVQLFPNGASQFSGFGRFGAIRVEFWEQPECGGGYCGAGYFMSEGASQILSSTQEKYLQSEIGILAQYQALVSVANAGQRVEWVKEGAMTNPLIYEFKSVTPEGTAFCTREAYVPPIGLNPNL